MATRSDDGRTHATSAAITTAAIGDEIIRCQNIAPRDLAAMPSAACAALVHSRRCFPVIVLRTSVRTMASTITDDSYGRNAIASALRSRLTRRVRRRPASAGNIGARRIANAPRVQSRALPGSQTQPKTSSTSSDGRIRLRRRLSAIFHRSMGASLFLGLPPSVEGTLGSSQEQELPVAADPAMHPHRVRGVVGRKPLEQTMSLARAVRPWIPSKRSWLTSAFSGTRPSTLRMNASTS